MQEEQRIYRAVYELFAFERYRQGPDADRKVANIDPAIRKSATSEWPHRHCLQYAPRTKTSIQRAGLDVITSVCAAR